MKQQEAFLQSIVEAPDDDTPRLVYADWLEEHGKGPAEIDRAAFIRAQIELAKLPPEERPADLLFQEGDPLRRHGVAWAKPTSRITQRYEFGRGFVDKVTLNGAKFLDVADRLFAGAPIRRVRLLMVKPAIEALCASPHLGRIAELDLHSAALGAQRTVLLAASPHLGGIREMNLGNNSVRPSGLAALGEADLGSLTGIDLNLNELTDASCKALARSPLMGRLKRLNLGKNAITEAGLRHFEGVSNLALIDLDLSQVLGSGDRFARALAGGDCWGGLRELHLGHTALTDAGLAALARAPHLANLRHLNLEGNRITDEGAIALAESPYLTNLAVLDLGRMDVGLKGARALAGSAVLGGLRHLALSVKKETAAEGAAELLARPELGQLTTLSLTETRLGPHHVSGLGEATHLNRLAHLSLQGSYFGDEGVAAVAAMPHLASLVSLDLRNNTMGDAGAEALAASPYLTHLLRLQVDKYRLTKKGSQALIDRFGAAACSDS